MNWRRGAAVTALLAGSAGLAAEAHAARSTPAMTPTDTVFVAAPTGENAIDRASILAALEQVRPGGTVQFAPGTYLVGEIIEVAVPRATLLGHADGTTLKGCDPVAWQEMMTAADEAEVGEARWNARARCGMLRLTGGHATVRNLTFEDTNHGLVLGWMNPSLTSEGGHHIEGNTFRNSGNGLRVGRLSSGPTVIRRNRFINTYHALGGHGGHLQIVDNDISVPEPEREPWAGNRGNAIALCGEHNVIAGNRIAGHPEGIRLAWGWEVADACRHNVIRDNTIIVHRTRALSPPPGFRLLDEADSTLIGTPLILGHYTAEGAFEDNLIEGNHIIGAEGIGIEVRNAVRNRIVNNTITGVVRRHPFPGNWNSELDQAWRDANGSGIWVSPGSAENEIAGNTFADIAAHAIVLEGDSNVVETRGDADRVSDLGRGNRVGTGAAARETGYATGADEVRLFYRIEGWGPDTVIVLHGGPALGLAYLAPDLEPLGREHTLLFYDQRGVGRSWSERDVDLSVDRHIEDLEALRSHFGIGRLRLAAHSWGAMLAARYAVAYPERVERMLFIDPMVPAKTYVAEAGSGARRLMQERLDSVSLAVLDSLVRAAADAPDARGHCRTLFELLVPLYFTDAAAAHRSRGDFCAGSDDAIRARSRVNAAIMGSVGDDVRPLLSRVRSPVLIVHGGSGAIPTEAMHAWTDALPDARLMVIPDAGHYLHVERPDVFFPAALQFLGGSWPAGTDVHSAAAVSTRSDRHIRGLENSARAHACGADTVHVAPPRGELRADRASILAALERLQPGGTVQFAPGTYLIGEMIRVTEPRVTLLGHADGTTLRGCDPEDFADMETAMELCNGLELAGARQTVRGLTFEHAFWALHLGCCYDERASYDFPDGTSQELPLVRPTEGGHLVEGNTFRSNSSGIRVNGGWTEPAIVRGNGFIDNWHGVSINGHTVHVLDNHFSVPQPERVPNFGYPWDAIKIAPPMPIQGETGPPACIGNVIAGNTIEGYVDGIRVEVYLPGSICRENVIRDNTITVRRAHNPSGVHFHDGGDPSDSTVVGVPIALLNDPMSSGAAASDPPAVVEANIVEGNRIFGAEGIGIEVLRSSRNRIVNNVIEGIVAREPFPGNTVAGAPDAWRDANGSGIWISPGSDGNEIIANTFIDVAAHAVVLEGYGNTVETRSVADGVRDLGSGNRVSDGPPGAWHPCDGTPRPRLTRRGSMRRRPFARQIKTGLVWLPLHQTHRMDTISCDASGTPHRAY
jgi:parallel beta-helix repeat protein